MGNVTYSGVGATVFTVPTGVTAVNFAFYSGGGPGGAGSGNPGAGGGGAGGNQANGTITVIPGATYAIFSGGTATSVSGVTGNGTITSFGTTGTSTFVYVAGGLGGAPAIAVGSVGRGATGSTAYNIFGASVTVTSNFRGGWGATGATAAGASGGGGGQAANGSNGANANGGTGGGIALQQNSGGNGGGDNQAGQNGVFFGGGGGGGKARTNTDRLGGAGMWSFMSIDWTDPPSSGYIFVDPMGMAGFFGI